MEKSAEAFRTISEVSELLHTPAHVLRFWESRFSQIKPVKRAGGRRYYRPSDLALLGGIKQLLHVDGLTIRGVQKILKEQGTRQVAELSAIASFLENGGKTAPDTSEPVVAESPDRPSAEKETDLANERPQATAMAATPRLDVSPGAERRAALGRGDAVPEAPMDVDVPTLPREKSVRPLDGPGTAPAGSATGQATPPAAAMLRAMDSLRAEDKKAELMSVYLRLIDLKNRLSGDGQMPGR